MRNLEDRRYDPPADPSLYKNPVQRRTVLPCKLLHDRTGPGSAHLSDRNRIKRLERTCRIPGDRTSGTKYRTCAAVRRIRKMGTEIRRLKDSCCVAAQGCIFQAQQHFIFLSFSQILQPSPLLPPVSAIFSKHPVFLLA